MKSAATIYSIRKFEMAQVPLAEGLAWRTQAGFRFEEKMDGQFHVRTIEDCMVVGEKMKDGRFFAFDVAIFKNVSLLAAPLSERLDILDDLTKRHGLLRPAVVNGGEGLEAIIRDGGEGMVAKDLRAPFGAGMVKCKRSENFIVRLARFNGAAQSVYIADAVTGQPRGRVALLGGKVDRVRIGSLLKVVGFGLTDRGLIREPRLDNDTADSWLVQF